MICWVVEMPRDRELDLEFASKFGRRVRRLRAERNMEQKELARKVGVTNTTVSYWETFYRFPNASVVPALANALGVSTDYLLTGKETDVTLEEQIAALEKRVDDILERLDAKVPELKQKMDDIRADTTSLREIDRLEVIDREGRVLTRRGFKGLCLSYQDDGHTLKVFIG